MPFRGKTIRRKIVALLLVPLLSLTALWAFATVITGREAARLLDAAEVVHKVGDPAQDAVRALQMERRETLVHLAGPRSGPSARLRALQRVTDRTIAVLRTRVDGDAREDMSSAAAHQFRTLEKGFHDLATLRHKVQDHTTARESAYQAYNELIDPYYEFLGALDSVQDAELAAQGRALMGLCRAHEAVSREDALLTSAFAAATLDARERRAIADRIAERKILYRTNLTVLPVADQKLYDDYWEGANARTLRAAEETLVLAGTGRPTTRTVDAKHWQAGIGTVLDDLTRLDSEALAHHRDRLQPVASWTIVKAAVAGILGLAALICSAVISWRISRGLIRELRALRQEAHQASDVRLPTVLRRLAAGAQIDVATEAPLLDYPPNELGQVGRALNTLQRAAVEAAVQQADLRRGVSDVFVNLARRNQLLLHRQLTLLNTMGRRTEDPDELADLSRLDHLTTRMRRHAEGLVILSGATPSRQWHQPVPLMDVVRAAVTEVEAYERIELHRLPGPAVLGPAVADLTHLLAELLENATVFSPRHTAVQIVGDRVPNGFTLEIHDRGPGMTPDALLTANLGLAEAPEFKLSDTDRLGLFVVSRLARRQGVRVSLRPSPYGGITAVVLIPAALLTDAPGGTGEPDSPTATGSSLFPVRGPVELEPPLTPFDGPATPDEQRRPPHTPPTPPGGRTHQADDTDATPPRRRPPVLISDHGRTVTDPAEEPAPPGTLPRRTRRPHPTRRPAPRAEPRDADDVRARMTSLQRGWQRGRRTGPETAEENAPTPPPRTTAPGTTTERDGR